MFENCPQYLPSSCPSIREALRRLARPWAAFPAALALVHGLLLSPSSHAAELEASDGAAGDQFGRSVSLSGTSGLIGAPNDDDKGNDSGSAYIYRNLDAASGTINQQVKLTASDGAGGDLFGFSVSLSGTSGLVGAYGDDDNASSSGSAYLFRDLHVAGPTKTQDVKLTASDGAAGDSFGQTVYLSGTSALVGSIRYQSSQGSAYLFRDLHEAGPTKTEDVKLTASDGAANDFFGNSLSLSGTSGLVGAPNDDDKGNNSGSAYLFRNLHAGGPTKTEDAKLNASDGAASDSFGHSVSLSGTSGLVGAPGDDDKGSGSGSAYLFRNLHVAGLTKTEDVKLNASDGAASDSFGHSVSLSGTSALVGAHRDDDKGNNSGSAYLFRNLHAAGSTKTQDVKLTASGGAANDFFGESVSLDGDNFLIAAYTGDGNFADSGKAYSGSVSSMTTLDTGAASRSISGLSFVSQVDWIIGESTSGNAVTLEAGDSATVTAADKAVQCTSGKMQAPATTASPSTAHSPPMPFT